MHFIAGIFGGGRPKTTPTSASGLQLQTSTQGLPIPLVFGTNKVAPNLIDYMDFVATQQESSAGAGGKGGVGGGGGGKGGGGSAGYIYQAGFIFGLCDGPINGVGQVFVNKQITTLSSLGYSLFLGDYAQTAWSYLTTNHPTKALAYRGLAYIANPAYQLGNSPQIPNHNVEVSGRYSNSVAQEVFGEKWTIPASPYQVTVGFAAQWTSDVSVTDADGVVYTKVGSSPAALQYTAAAGVYTFNSANAARNVYINYNASAGPDADPSLVLNFLLTDARSGAGFPSAKVGSLTAYQNYCIALGLLVSPAYIQQSAASQIITELTEATNSALVFSSGVLSVVPYGDQSITANGKTYTAPSAPQYNLGPDDYIHAPGDDPVRLQRTSNADAYNSIQLECLDRANQYNPAVIGAKDQALIDTYGLRENSIQSHIFANLAAGRLSAQLRLQKENRRNKYTFTLDHRYLLLDCMDIVTLTDAGLGLTNEWVRILTIDENADGNFDFVVEEFLAGTSASPLHSFQSTVGYTADYNTSPGNANTPVIFEPPVQISQSGELEVDIATSGGANWGGCQIWISTDGSTYKQAGRVTGNSRQGILSALLATGVDPDTTNTAHVNLAMSAAQLLSGTQADADGNHTLCYVDGELISYRTATLTSPNNYDLTYLRRGQFGSTISSHANGSKFARLDDGIFAYPYDKSKIGTTIYIKILGYNLFGGGLQSLATVSPYTYVIQGPPKPAAVAGFQAQQSGNVVVFNWIEGAYTGGLKGYDIAYGVVGSTWENKNFLTEALRGTEMTNASIPPGAWEFSIRARDIADNLSDESLATLTVTNQNSLIYSTSGESLGWPGTLVNFVKHYTNVLTPIGSKTVDQYSAISPPPAPTLGTTPGGVIALTTYYVKTTYLDAGGESLPSAEASQLVLLNNLLTVASPAASGLATSYGVYVSTATGTETLQAVVPIGTNWTEPTTGLVAGAAVPTVNTTGWQVFNQFVPDPVSSASYTTPQIDTGYDANVRVYSTIGFGMGFGQTGTPNMDMLLDSWLSAGSDLGVFVNWIIGFITLRYLRERLSYTGITDGNVAYVTDFTPYVDSPLVAENAIATIAPGGTVVVFSPPFHAAPYVQATVISGTALSVDVTSISATQCTMNVYNTSNTSVGGTVNYTATGQ